MTLTEIIEISAAVLISLGGAGGIVAALSNWLGKVWADRMMETEKHHHEKALIEHQAAFERKLSTLQAEQEKDLAQLRSNLEQQSQGMLEQIRSELDVSKQKHLKSFHDKLDLYRLTSNLIADLLGDIDRADLTKQKLSIEQFDQFNRGRIRAYAYIGMIAPQNVMDAFDDLIDYLLLVSHGNAPYVWQTVREKALVLLNEIRKDIGIDCLPICYNGKL